MSRLPAWVERAKDSVPAWIAGVAHDSGPGRYRCGVRAHLPHDLQSSMMMAGTLATLRMAPRLSPEAELRRARYFLDHQRPADGLIVHEEMERHLAAPEHRPVSAELLYNTRRSLTRNVLITVEGFGFKPRHLFRDRDSFRSEEDLLRYLDGLPWHNAWQAGAWAGTALQFLHFSRILGDATADRLFRACVDWLARNQNPETGGWPARTGAHAPHNLINGIFKVWIQVLPIAPFPIQYPERVVDLCIAGMDGDPFIRDSLDTCSIFDVALVLDTALRFTGHRHAEAADKMLAFLPRLEVMYRDDGAFSYGPDGSPNYASGSWVLGPLLGQSDATATNLMTSAIALIANIAGLRQELGWEPVTSYRMHLDGKPTDPGTLREA